jgi:hypothetical protein
MRRLQGKLDRDGAVVNVLVAISAAKEAFLKQQGHPVPAPFATTALIDSGASQTVVAPFVVAYLKLAQTGTAEVLVVSKSGAAAEESFPVYDLAVSLQAHPGFSRKVEAVSAWPATSGVSLLIGRDILDQCRFLFDGVKRRFTLWY